MPRYIVVKKEVFYSLFGVDAESPQEARDIVANGGGAEVSAHPEYAFELDKEKWSVEDEEGNIVLD